MVLGPWEAHGILACLTVVFNSFEVMMNWAAFHVSQVSPYRLVDRNQESKWESEKGKGGEVRAAEGMCG